MANNTIWGRLGPVALKLSTELMEGAFTFARSAVTAYIDGNPDVFALHAGVSIERLAKCALVLKNPALILDFQGRGQFKNLAYLTGWLEGDLSELRTIGLTAALDRLEQLGDLSGAQRAELKYLVDLRNGAAHAGVQEIDADDLLNLYVRTVDHLLRNRGELSSKIWNDDLRPLVEHARQKATSAIEHKIQLTIHRARVKYQEKIKNLPPAAVSAIGDSACNFVSVFADGAEEKSGLTSEIPCPACGCAAALIFRKKHLDADPTDWKAAFFGVLCGACELRLGRPEVLDMLNIDMSEIEWITFDAPLREVLDELDDEGAALGVQPDV